MFIMTLSVWIVKRERPRAATGGTGPCDTVY